jgi:hypothetical protein
MDFVFASTALAPRVRTPARNGPEWTSDHCQVEITLGSEREGGE